MKAVDSSVVIAAFATWHEHHAIARKAMTSRPRLIAHAAIESYSVLTRLPPPHRAHPLIVHSFITERFTEPFLTLSETGYQELLATITAGQILAGPAYDALIAFTAVEHQATLLSLDQRATPTYEAIGATVDQLVPGVRELFAQLVGLRIPQVEIDVADVHLLMLWAVTRG